MKRFITVIILLISVNNFGQVIETSFYDADDQLVDSINAIRYTKKIVHDSLGINKTVEEYKINGKLKELTNYSKVTGPESRFKKFNRNGLSTHYYDNGKLTSVINFKNDELHGNVETYFENGKLRRSDIYEEDNFVSGQCYDVLGNKVEHYIYIEKPTYLGGYKAIGTFLSKKLKYPSKMARNGLEGTVLIKFLVLKNGNLAEIETRYSPSIEFEKEALRVLNLLNDWVPGKIEGEPTDFKFMLPITFKLK